VFVTGVALSQIDDDYSTLLPEGFKYICTPVFSTFVPSYERTLILPDNVNAAFAAATPRGMSFIPPKEAVPRPPFAPYGSGLPCCTCVDVCVFPTCECMRRNKCVCGGPVCLPPSCSPCLGRALSEVRCTLPRACCDLLVTRSLSAVGAAAATRRSA
jgi:hypothetical protein